MGILNLQHYCRRQTQHYQDNRSNKTRNQRNQRNPGVTNFARWYEPSTSSFGFSSERTPAAVSNTSRGAVVFKARLFLLLRLLKNKDSSEGNSSDLKQIFIFACWEPIHQRKKEREKDEACSSSLFGETCAYSLWKTIPYRLRGRS